MDNSSDSSQLAGGAVPPSASIQKGESRGRPTERGARGRFLKREGSDDRRRMSAELRARGVSWNAIAAAHWGGDRSLAIRETNRWYVDNPSEDVQTQRRIVVDGLENLEAIVRDVMQRRHFVVSQRGVVLDAEGEPLLDDQPIYQGVDRILKIKETLGKFVPGLLAPKVTAEISAEALDAEIAAGREALAREMAALSDEDDGVSDVESGGDE